ncbi:MAG: histidine kinase [Bacteroidales bacterium]|nr:histidine kinase [Bacteroidales bacterium]
MKTKTFFLTLLFFICFNQTWSANEALDADTEKQYWEFIKERLFDGENNITSKFQKNIYIQLTTDSKEDSIIVTNLLEELQALIPNKNIGYCNSSNPFSEIDVAYELIFLSINKNPINSNGHIKRSTNINGNQIFYSGFKGISQPEIYYQTIHIQRNDTISFGERKRYIEYAVLRSLCTIKGDPGSAKTFFENAVFNDFSYEPHNTEFSEVDKFLLQKLYADDFLEQFKHHLVGNYSRKYYRAFLYKHEYQSIKIFLAVLIILLAIALSYKTIIFRTYKRKFVGYITIALLVGATANVIHLVFQLVANTGVYFDRFNSNLMIAGELLILPVIAAIILFGVEYLFIRPSMSFTKKTFFRMISIFVILNIPPIILKLIVPTRFNTAGIISFITFSLIVASGRGLLLYIKEVGDSTIRKKDFELVKLQELNAKAEIQSLNAKINPHFLYNSLNSIAGLARCNPEKTEQMAIALSDLYKYSTNRFGEQTTSIKKELEMIKSYLKIEKIRFAERLKYSIQVDSDVLEILIPRNIIQPLVENAIKHGIANVEDEGHIELSIQKSHGGIMIKVFDNGPAFPEGLVSGFGLQSIQDIIKLHYKGKAQLSWQNEPKKMVILEINSML